MNWLPHVVTDIFNDTKEPDPCRAALQVWGQKLFHGPQQSSPSVVFWARRSLSTVHDKLNDCYLWNKNFFFVIHGNKERSGNNHFQFAMLLLTECFFPQRSKCINSHWSLRWSSIYLFSQKSSPFTSKVASTNSNSSRKPQENSRLKNARSILNDPSFSRLWGSFLLTLFLGFFVFFISSFISSLWGTSILLSIRSSCLQAGQLCVPSLLPGSKASFDAHILTLNLCEFWGSQAPCSYWAHGIQLGSWLFGEMEMEDIHHFDGEKIYSRKLHLGKTATNNRSDRKNSFLGAICLLRKIAASI